MKSQVSCEQHASCQVPNTPTRTTHMRGAITPISANARRRGRAAHHPRAGREAARRTNVCARAAPLQRARGWPAGHRQPAPSTPAMCAARGAEVAVDVRAARGAHATGCAQCAAHAGHVRIPHPRPHHDLYSPPLSPSVQLQAA